MKVFILLPFLFLAVFTITYAASSKEEYELQERCGKRTEELFKRDFGNGINNTDDGYSLDSYSNHYNKKLNKCFILLTSIGHSKKYESDSTSYALYDVNENKEYGSYITLKSAK